MSTALDLITDAYSMLGAHGQGETLSAADSAWGLRRLNAMLESWSTENLNIYHIIRNTVTATGAASYNLTALFVTRPLALNTITFTTGGQDSPVEIISSDMYEAIPVKTTAGTPRFAYIDNTVLYPFPVPASGTFNIGVQALLRKFQTQELVLTDTTVFPYGYERAISYNLAIELAASLGKEPPNSVVAIARESKGNIKRLNREPLLLKTDFGRRYYNINEG